MRHNPMRFSKARKKNPRIHPYIVWGAMIAGGWLLYKKVSKAAGAAIDGSKERAAMASAGFGDLPSGAIPREHALLQGVGGVFGGRGTLG